MKFAFSTYQVSQAIVKYELDNNDLETFKFFKPKYLFRCSSVILDKSELQLLEVYFD
jgi:hypothetical protein